MQEWSPSRNFTEELVAKGVPQLLTGSVTSTWPAVLNWTNLESAQALLGDLFVDVKRSSDSLFLDPDTSTPLAPHVTVPLTYGSISCDTNL